MCNTKNDTDPVDVFQTAEELQETGETRRDDDIMKARIWLKQQHIPQSGYNKTLKYHYFKFEDFISYVQEACVLYDLSTHFTVEHIFHEPVLRPATMRNEVDRMPTFNAMGLLEIKSKHYHEPRRVRVPLQYQLLHQDIGKAVNYSKRYAYMIGFEISDVDVVDMELGEKEVQDTQKQHKYTNGEKLGNAERAEPVNQTTLNTPRQNNKRNIQDLARNIAEEMTEKGIETTASNIREYTTNLFREQKISNVELRELRAKIQAGEIGA